MTPPTYAEARAACCVGIDLSRCPDVARDEMGSPPRCDDYEGAQRAVCHRLGIDPDDPDARFGDRYEDIVDATTALFDARPVCTLDAADAFLRTHAHPTKGP